MPLSPAKLTTGFGLRGMVLVHLHHSLGLFLIRDRRDGTRPGDEVQTEATIATHRGGRWTTLKFFIAQHSRIRWRYAPRRCNAPTTFRPAPVPSMLLGCPLARLRLISCKFGPPLERRDSHPQWNHKLPEQAPRAVSDKPRAGRGDDTSGRHSSTSPGGTLSHNAPREVCPHSLRHAPCAGPA